MGTKSTWAKWMAGFAQAAVAVWLVTACAAAVAQPPGPETVEAVSAEEIVEVTPAAPAEEIVAPEGTAISEAERFFRQGVDLYKRNLFSEALSAFNRALALDPSLEEARAFRDRAQAKLQIGAAGGEPSAVPTFETFEPEAEEQAAGPDAGPLSAEELKVQRVRELLDLGERYLENQHYAEAVKYFEQVVLIAPDNQRARENLHQATVGAQQEAIRRSEKQVIEDRAQIRRFIENEKTLPEGADATGIKPFRISVPLVEEQTGPEESRSEIEKALDESIVTIEFENEHISRIIDFLSEYVSINFMIDPRVVAPPARAQAAAAAAAPGAPGVPGAPGAPGAPGVPGAPGAAGAPTPYPAPGAARPGVAAQPQAPGAQPGGAAVAGQQYVTDGIVAYVGLKKVPLRTALTGLLRGLNLDYSIEQDFIWISTPERIREESFEQPETRYYDLQITAAETVYKLGLNLGANAGGGGIGGGGGGGGNITTGGNVGDIFADITDLFTTVPDYGEPPPTIGLGSTGTTAIQGGQAQAGGGQQVRTQQTAPAGGAQQQAGGAGAAGGQQQYGQPIIIQLLRRLKRDFDTYEPRTNALLSDMIYNPLTNQLIVTNTPKKLRDLERILSRLDTMPKQVSIESKFLTINTEDLKKIGFNWDLTLSNLNNRPRQVVDEDGNIPDDYEYDINGDGDNESVPFYTRPDGSNVFRDLIATTGILGEANPGPPGNFSWTGIITDNSDGDMLSVTLDFLDQLTESELLSAPRVTTMNGRPAAVADSTREFFVTEINTEASTSEAGFGGTPTSTITNEPVVGTFVFGVGLSVTPIVVAGDNVRLWLSPKVTNRLAEKEFTATQVQGDTRIDNTFRLPTISTQQVYTNVIVHDGDTLVLGGLVTDQTNTGNHKLPYIADVPVLGFFFKGKSREVRQSSLLVFVTPTIIDPTGARVIGSSQG